MQLTKKDYFPSLSFHGRLQCIQRGVTEKFSLQPFPANPSADKKRYRRAAHISEERDQKPPPQAEEESGADAQNPARQEQHIATGIKKRITDRAPNTPMHDVLLNRRQKIRERKLERKEK